MNDLKETPVVTLKAELVEDFDFLKTVQVISKFGQRTLAYPSNFRVVAPIKVGNSIKDITFSTSYEGYASLIPFQSLIDAGIAIDFSDVTKKYEKELANLKVAIALEEEELEKAFKLKKYNDWPNTWIHDFNDILTTKKFSIFKDGDVKIEKISREEYSENIRADLYVKVTYKELSTKIFTSDGKYCYSEATRKQGDKVETAYISSFNSKSYGSKTRKAQTTSAILNKFLSEVNEYIRVNEMRVNRLNKEENDRNAKLEELKDVFDCMVILERNYKSSYQPNKSGYYVYEYFIQKGSRKIKIDTSHNTKYENGEHVIIEKLYNLAGFTKLTQAQVRAMIKVIS